VPRSAVVFSMHGRGHLQRLRPLITGLVAAGMPAHVFTHEDFRDSVERAGGRFVDLFAGRPLESLDATSMPIPSRGVTFAAHCADAVAQEAAACDPAIVIHDTFAVVGQAVANRLGLPRINVCAGHNAAPQPTIAALRRDPRVAISAACHDAVHTLRERYGIHDASPFSYLSSQSDALNVYCEPEEFLRAQDRAPFEPIAFFGSLPIDGDADAGARLTPFGAAAAARQRIYVSFGTIIWHYYTAEALRALAVIADALASRDDVEALISLGGAERSAHAAALTRHNVQVEGYVDQWQVLRDATLFITHHGLNSTHEAVFQRTPMLSYPFFADQPEMALRCRELGLAVPLTTTPRHPLTAEDVHAALAAAQAQHAALSTRLAEAREWELATMHRRPAVIERIIALSRR